MHSCGANPTKTKTPRSYTINTTLTTTVKQSAPPISFNKAAPKGSDFDAVKVSRRQFSNVLGVRNGANPFGGGSA